ILQTNSICFAKGKLDSQTNRKNFANNKGNLRENAEVLQICTVFCKYDHDFFTNVTMIFSQMGP
ncbi:hypothetical protein, partial [Aeromonas sobria]|uniref:hypothetical protein n=1 Tax=Aeromonas sobria TaxID=646 RepID=UPI003F2FD48A